MASIGYDEVLFVIAAVTVLVGGIVSVSPPKRRYLKVITIGIFLVLSVASFVVSAGKERQVSKNQAMTQQKLDQEIGENKFLQATLDSVQAIVASGAQKQDVAQIVRILTDMRRTNDQIYVTGMSTGSQLETLGERYRIDVLSYRKDEREKLHAALLGGDRINIRRVQKHNLDEQRTLRDTYLGKLAPLLSTASSVLRELAKRLPDVQQPTPKVQSLLNTGHPDDAQTVQDLGYYVVNVAQKLPHH